MNPLADQIDDLLPQTQCGKCGYPGCRPYAEAIINNGAPINLCPPGGEDGIHELAQLLGAPFLPFGKDTTIKPPAVAFIIEADCIGCTLCLQACPVDAIAGASKLMHTIITQLCTGCELCIPPCPVDCIHMQPLPLQSFTREQKHKNAQEAKQRYLFRNERLERDKREKAERLAQKAAVRPTPQGDTQALIQAALERAKAQATSVHPRNTDHLTPAQQAQIDEAEARRGRAREQEHKEP